MLNFQRIGRIQFLAYGNLVFIAAVALILLGKAAAPGSDSYPTVVGALLATFGIAKLSAQRYRDVGASGWWALLFLIPAAAPVLYVLSACIPGDVRENRFGSPPSRPTLTMKLLAFLPWLIGILSAGALVGWMFTVLSRHGYAP